MSDGATDAYREEQASNRASQKLRANLERQNAELLYYKATQLHDKARDLWTRYGQDKPSLTQALCDPNTDAKELLLSYINELKAIIELPDDLLKGRCLYWSENDCYLSKGTQDED